MSAVIVGVIGFILLFILVFSCRIPIGIAMAFIGFLGFVYLVGLDAGLGILRTVPFRTAGSYTLSVVPLFVLMGDFSFRSGLSQELYSFGYKWLELSDVKVSRLVLMGERGGNSSDLPDLKLFYGPQLHFHAT